MINTLAADLHNQSEQARDRLSLAGRHFTRVCRSDEPIVPADTTLALISAPISSDVASAFTGYFDSKAQEKADAVNVEKSKFCPEFSVGYNRQKISPLKGLNSWRAISVDILPAEESGAPSSYGSDFGRV